MGDDNHRVPGWVDLFRKHSMQAAERILLALVLVGLGFLLRNPAKDFLQELEAGRSTRAKRLAEAVDAGILVCSDFDEWAEHEEARRTEHLPLSELRVRLRVNIGKLQEGLSAGLVVEETVPGERGKVLREALHKINHRVSDLMARAEAEDYRVEGRSLTEKRLNFFSVARSLVSGPCSSLTKVRAELRH